MKKVILLGLVLVLLVAAGTLMYRKQAVAPLETLDGQCTAAGGTIKESLCCKGVDSGPQTKFPNLCAIGACGCAPEYSKPTKICDCGEGKCFDGSTCTDLGR
ncbi:MAG: hypothetical protein UX65_C0007G0011 [Parcubacteria group bacterium GW2011_GWB1_46_8]|nr:MAG: hypothetical protein UX14_C0021G0007 [Parcubacteria group bacterium GW2011_GWF1_45_5]KKU10313.1 MAG: hypothetical protein UX15_C0033G0002 [Parcubacteria group bacterium GW2011_GWA1_45_7]KKU46208.1 MAG: hypothetical protein UX65_C0007G0011 [Parcubacteria group bacterium GW2011_GWB1_46_8]